MAAHTACGSADHLLAPRALLVWSGASGRRLPHIVYSLIGCPAPAAATYLLVRREADGGRSVLKSGRTESNAASLNLARIRHEGACLGANEVHLNVLGASDAERARIAFDLAGALIGPRPASGPFTRAH